MKRNYQSVIRGVFTLALMIVSAVLGFGGVYAMADVVIDPDPAPTAPDSKGLETQREGQASATNVTESGFNEEDIDQAIANFRPFVFPLEYDIANNAKQGKADGYEKIHYRSGVAVLEDTLTQDVTSVKGATEHTLTIDKSALASGALTCFPEYTGVAAIGVDNASGQDILFFVTSSSKVLGRAVLEVINSDEAVTIPAGTKLLQLGNACSESQMIVDPDNYQPEPTTVFLQKKVANIVFTDEWLQQAKKVKFVVEDLQDNALYNFKRKNARTRWLGAQYKTKVELSEQKMGSEYVYFEQGVLRQLTMFYSVGDDEITMADLNAIAKMQFTENSANNTARVYCGKNFIEKLLNMQMTVERGWHFEDKDEAGMKFRVWKNNFGELEFVHDPTLNDIGYEDFAVVADMKNAVHYVHRAQKTDKQDMKKGTGEIREAQRYIYSIIDCLALKGYNSILVGPASKIAVAQSLTNIESFASSVASLNDAEKVKGLIYYLTEDDDENGFVKGTLVTWDGVWVEYTGQLFI